MSISLNPSHYDVITPIQDSPLFTCIASDRVKKTSAYRLNVEKLSKDQCHIFYTDNARRNELIAAMLEFVTFNPLSRISSKFEIDYLDINKSILVKCSFPKEFIDVCEKAAKTFDMHIVHKKKILTDTHKDICTFDEKSFVITPIENPVVTQTITYDFPKANNILWVQGKKITEEQLHRYKHKTICFGMSLLELGID